jgi:hypothetical protein
MGVIAMKVFADGALYTKPAGWSNKPEHVVMTVGSPELPSAALIRYALDVPEVHVAIIGIGHISDNAAECQLISNIAAAQILPGTLTDAERRDIEERAFRVKEGKANYFQRPLIPLTAPTDIIASRLGGKVTVKWNTALAGGAALISYNILRDGEKVYEVPYKPQITTEPFVWELPESDSSVHEYAVGITDMSGKSAVSDPVKI